MNCQRDRILKGRCLLFLYLIGLRKNQPDVFRCLSFFYFFIPTGCSFNIFCIFGRRDVLPFLHKRTRLFVLKIAQAGFCLDFQTGDSPNQPHPADPATVPLLSGTQSSGSTTTLTECPNHGAYEPGNRSESYTRNLPIL